MRISDWSSDVCSSDLVLPRLALGGVEHAGEDHQEDQHLDARMLARLQLRLRGPHEEVRDVPGHLLDRKSVVSGKSGSVRVDLGGRRIIKKKHKNTQPDRMIHSTHKKNSTYQIR